MNIRCWWFGCDIHSEDPTPVEYVRCYHCDQPVSYSDMVGDTRHRRVADWCNYWLFRKWWPKRCEDCGRKWRACDESIDHIPF